MNIDNDLRQELNGFSIENRKDPAAYIVYTHLIVNANYENSDKVKRGQILTSFRKLSEETGLSERQIRTAVKKLITAKYITQRSTRYYTIFTLCHYDRKATDSTTAKQKKNSKSIKPNAADRQRYLDLCKKISHSPLTQEEKEFFNNYDYNEE